jgi:protein ImuA
VAAGLSLVVGGGNRASFDQPSTSDGEGWRLPAPEGATLSELFAASARDSGATGFLLAQLPRGKPLLWVQERMAILEAGRIYPPGLGLPELIHVAARDARSALWAMEEGLRCSALGAVIGEIWGDPQALDFTATRRLAVAAERNGVAAYLIRLGGHANLSGARMRWRVGSAPSLAYPLDPKAPGQPAWDAELFRARGCAPGRWSIAWDAQEQTMRSVSRDGTADRFDLVAAPSDRALVEGERRAG